MATSPSIKDPRKENLEMDDEHDDERFDYSPRPRQTLLEWVRDLPSTMRRRTATRGGYHAVASPHQDAETSVTLHGPRQFSTTALQAARRVLGFGPIIVLIIFGIIHITEALMGKARLFWSSGDEDFHFGDFIKGYPTDATRDITPVPIHSHNDYWRRLPLFDAIHAGCIGVEADVWLYDEELYVGHSVASLTRNRTFRSLYVNPLVNLLEQMNPHNEFGNTTGHGVFDTDADQTLILLVDFKTEPYKLWPVVNDQLSALRNRGYLSYWNGNQTISGPITVVATGEAPFDRVIANQTYRDIFFDAPLADLNPSAEKEHKASLIDTMFHKGKHGAASVEPGVLKRGEGGQGNSGVGAQPVEGFSTANSFYASTNFDEAVGKLRRGHIDPQQMEKIRSLIADAKRRGLLARFWNTPAWPISQRQHVWHVLMKEGAGILNVDDLRSASRADWRRWRSQWG